MTVYNLVAIYLPLSVAVVGIIGVIRVVRSARPK
jgi:hypothetical protein